MIEEVIKHILYVRRIPVMGKDWVQKQEERDRYNKLVIRSEQARIWYKHFKETGIKLNFKKINVDLKTVEKWLK